MFLFYLLTIVGFGCVVAKSDKIASGPIQITTCEGDTSSFECSDPNYGIRILNAVYGRADEHTCSLDVRGRDLSPCESRNATVHINKLCYGKNKCSFRVDNETFKSSTTCANKRKYLSYDVSCEPLRKLVCEIINRFDVRGLGTAEPKCRSKPLQTFVCETESKRIICNDNEKIIVISAQFGRQNDQDGGVCRLGTSNNNDQYCKPANITDEIQRQMCKDNECDIDLRFYHIQDPCVGIYKYTKVEFMCCPRF